MRSRPKLQTVADAAGVSLATASQVMRGTGRISDDTRTRVRAAADSLNYVPDGRAAAMRSGVNREVGLMIHHIANPFNAEVISGVSDMLETEAFFLSILDSRDDAARERRNLEAFIRSARGGLLWVPTTDIEAETRALFVTHRLPAVAFMRQVPGLGLDHVGLQNSAATVVATAHLTDLGHRRIAYFGGVGHGQVRDERIAGCRAALAERGLPPPVIWPSADAKLAGLDAAIKLHAAHPEVTGIVCNGDMVALGACLALQRIGLVPGREVSVVGFDDIADAAVATPPLTTMAVNPAELGRRLAQVLLERIGNPDAPEVTLTLPATLVVRATTGPARPASPG